MSAATANAMDSASAMRARRADQLDAGLGELVLAASARRLVAENAADVRQAQRQRLIEQPGPDDARRGDRHIGAQGQGATVAVEEAIHLRIHLRADIGRQGVGVFEGRQADLAIAPGRPGGLERRLHAAESGRIGEQQIAHPFRERPLRNGRSVDEARSDIGSDPINKKGLVEDQPVLGQAPFRRRCYTVRLPRCA